MSDVAIKTYSPKLEALAIATILDGPETLASYLLGKLRPDIPAGRDRQPRPGHFGDPLAASAFERILSWLRHRGSPGDQFGGRQIFGEDPSVPEELRVWVRNLPRPITDQRKARQLVRMLDRYRKVRLVSQALAESSDKLAQSGDPDAALGILEHTLLESKSAGTSEPIRSSTPKAKKLVKQVLFGQPEQEIIPTGFRAFDGRSGGFHRGNLVVISGPTGGGKSVMAVTLMLHQAKAGYRVCLVSLEMDEDEVMARVLSAVSDLSHTDIANKRLGPRERTAVIRAWTRWQKEAKGEFALWSPGEDLTASQLIARLRPYQFDVVIVDYIGLLAPDKGDTEAQQLGQAARLFKIAAVEQRAVYVVLAQYDQARMLIRYSRAIKEHADKMWTWVYDDQAKESGVVTIRQEKARNAPMYNFSLLSRFEVMRWEDVPPEMAVPAARQETSMPVSEIVLMDDEDDE